MGQECQTVPQCLVTLEKKNNICLKKCVDGHVKHNIFIFCGLIKKKEKREREDGERDGERKERKERTCLGFLQPLTIWKQKSHTDSEN